ncbi:thioredoxin-like protein [Mrakia frigida]|uniref:thioredoxin-like protein n=1 Tax=Mrakia frigida TaxID=29902 RepID=UPI003FCC0035
MLSRLLSAALLLPLLVQAGTFEKPVIALGPKEFNKVMKEDRMSMVVFYAPWCGHCKNLAPEYAQAATSLSPIIPFYSVDCDEDANKPLCAKYDVKGFPTIKGFTRGAKIPPKDYTGERKRGGLVGWATSMVGDKVKKMKVPSKGGVSKEDGLKEIEGFLKADSSKPHVLLIHPNSATIPLMWKALSQQISTYSFGYIRDADAAVRGGLSLSSDPDGPKIIFWKAGASSDEMATSFESYEALSTRLAFPFSLSPR